MDWLIIALVGIPSAFAVLCLWYFVASKVAEHRRLAEIHTWATEAGYEPIDETAEQLRRFSLHLISEEISLYARLTIRGHPAVLGDREMNAFPNALHARPDAGQSHVMRTTSFLRITSRTHNMTPATHKLPDRSGTLPACAIKARLVITENTIELHARRLLFEPRWSRAEFESAIEFAERLLDPSA